MNDINLQNGFIISKIFGGDIVIEAPKTFVSVVDNGDNTITATDERGLAHKLRYSFDSKNRISNVLYDNKSITIEYNNNDEIVKIGETDIDISTIPEAPQSAFSGKIEFPKNMIADTGIVFLGTLNIEE